MKLGAALLVFVPVVLAAQESTTVPGAVSLEIRSADTKRVLTVAVDVQGALFGSLGVLRPAPGQVHCGPTGCTATTPSVLELTLGRGEGRLSVPDTSAEMEVTVLVADARRQHIVARGHALSFSRDERGGLRIQAPRIETRQ